MKSLQKTFLLGALALSLIVVGHDHKDRSGGFPIGVARAETNIVTPADDPGDKPIVSLNSGHKNEVESAVISPDKRYVLSAGLYEIILWDFSSGHVIRRREGRF